MSIWLKTNFSVKLVTSFYPKFMENRQNTKNNNFFKKLWKKPENFDGINVTIR